MTTLEGLPTRLRELLTACLVVSAAAPGRLTTPRYPEIGAKTEFPVAGFGAVGQACFSRGASHRAVKIDGHGGRQRPGGRQPSGASDLGRVAWDFGGTFD